MQVKVKFTDSAEQGVKKETFQALEGRGIQIIESDNPDFLIYSVGGGNHLKYNCPRIFITGENIQPDFNVCDYAVAFSYISFEDRYRRIPLYKFYVEDYNRALVKHLAEYTSEELKRKGFCNFVYSNGISAMECRERFFFELSKYKKVDSGGRFLNNIGGPIEDKIDFQSRYKFSIAFENASVNGYTTEKVLQAFAAGTIPIYFGNPRISEDFNPKAFINCHEFETFDQVIELIKEIDADDELYMKYIREPLFYDMKTAEKPLKEYGDFLEYIFTEGARKGIRRGDSQAVVCYQQEISKKWILKNLRDNRTIKNRVIRKYLKYRQEQLGLK